MPERSRRNLRDVDDIKANVNPSHKLTIQDLSVRYLSSGPPLVAVNAVSITLESGRSLGIVGESGSGKSTMALAVMRLLPDKARVQGRVLLDGRDLLECSELEMSSVRGRQIGMVFQDSLAALNPVFSIRSQLVDTIRRHAPELDRGEARQRAEELVAEVGIPAGRLGAYPHQFSGGMRQRVMVAAALAPGPSFLLADESTSDLDTVSQRQILDLLKQVSKTRGLGLMVVSHDLGVIYDVCESVAVMYRGNLVEYGRTREVLRAPKHWYTSGLLALSSRELDERGYLRTMAQRTADSRQDSDQELSADLEGRLRN